jgi:hypothetical protein
MRTHWDNSVILKSVMVSWIFRSGKGIFYGRCLLFKKNPGMVLYADLRNVNRPTKGS